jgi:hypothetical protein
MAVYILEERKSALVGMVLLRAVTSRTPQTVWSLYQIMSWKKRSTKKFLCKKFGAVSLSLL